MEPTENRPQPSVIGQIAALMRKHGFSCSEEPSRVLVDDPVHTLRGGMCIQSGTHPVAVRNMPEAFRFIQQRC